MSYGKRPASQFYWADWMRDAGLRSVSEGARGVWIDLLCIMHDGEPYGHLAVNGVALTDHQAAKMTGVPVPKYRRYLAELEAAGVPSRTEAGVLFSRRMVRDEEIRRVRAAAGSIGGQVTNNPARHFAAAKSKQTDQQTGRHPVAAAAAADVVVVGLEGGAGETRARRIREALSPDSRGAFDGFLRASHNPLALLGELEMAVEAQGATWGHVGAALRDLSLAGHTSLTGKLLRAFVKGAKREEIQSGTGGAVDEFTALERKLSRAG